MRKLPGWISTVLANTKKESTMDATEPYPLDDTRASTFPVADLIQVQNLTEQEGQEISGTALTPSTPHLQTATAGTAK